MIINNVKVDTAKLLSKTELLNHLREDGESDRALSKIREQYTETFRNELMWRYPITDSEHAGVMIIVVREGFVKLPYDYMTKDEGEIYELEKAALLDEDALNYLIDDWKLFSDDLQSALADMLKVTLGERSGE